MSENLPQPECPRMSDDEMVDHEMYIADSMEKEINDATAHVISSQLHDGQASHLYALASTGFISDAVLQEIERTYNEFDGNEQVQNRIAHLATYVVARMCQPDGTGRVSGWAGLWLDEPKNDLCACCAAPIVNPHRVGCPLGTDNAEELDRVLELQAEHGTAALHWLNYAGYRNLDELNQRAEQFPEYYYGFFPDVETFRNNYEVSPDAYLEQQYEIVEGDGGFYIYDR